VAPGAPRAVLLERDGMRLELLSFGREERDPGGAERAAPPALRAADSPGLSHLTFLVDDLRSTLRSLRDRGVAIDDATLVEHATGAASCLVRDPEGWPVLLVQQPAGVATPYDPAPATAAVGSGASPGEGSR
jgi:catechol 2,3-dioxygenase-like lactoylglutathione lyase family enzyme